MTASSSQFFPSLFANITIPNIPRDYFIGRSGHIPYLLKIFPSLSIIHCFLTCRPGSWGHIGVIVRALFLFVT